MKVLHETSTMTDKSGYCVCLMETLSRNADCFNMQCLRKNVMEIVEIV